MGREGTIKTREGFRLRVRVIDARVAYGRTEVLAEGLQGEGKAWVDRRRVRFSRGR
jgi:hypothetical protein